MEPDADRAAWGAPARPENLWPARLAILCAIALYVTLPDRLTIGPSWGPPVLEAVLVASLTVMAPVRHTREIAVQRLISYVLTGLINLANISSLVLLIAALLHHGVALQGRPLDGPTLLFAALEVWLTNILVFALWYWELDRGGPVERRRPSHREPDFLFPQMVTPGCTQPEWNP
jgi:hypothetical protein